jgi:hypothetical protein
MRRLLSIFAALAVAGLLAAPVSAAAAQTGWDTFTDQSVFDGCTGEVVDNGGTDHYVVTDGFAHDNVHFVGTGETSGVTYVGDNTLTNPVHPSADGTFTADFTAKVRLVSTTGAANLQLTFTDRQVFDSSGNLISETTNFSSYCRG